MSEITKPPDKDEKMTAEDYEHLLNKYQYSTKEVTPGKIVKGKVIKVTGSHVLVDIGLKSEGVIPIEEFIESATPSKPKEGDAVEAVLEKTDRKEGYFILSKKSADIQKALDVLEKAFDHQTFITGKITEKTKNGYTVNVGIDTFMPDSHADVRIVKDPDKLIGQSFKFKVIKFDKKSENAVLSRKLFLLDEREKKRRKVFSHLVKGQTVKGQVKSLTNFGAFIDLGGVEGLLHVSDISWGKISHPSEVLHVGQEVEVLILDFNEKNEKISLGYKQLTPDPWAGVQDRPEGHRQGHEPHRFWRIRRARKGRRGPRPCLRPELVAEDDPSQKASVRRRRGHRDRARRQSDFQKDLPRSQAILAPSP
jgi:small subunit ribosomal protein S1